MQFSDLVVILVCMATEIVNVLYLELVKDLLIFFIRTWDLFIFWTKSNVYSNGEFTYVTFMYSFYLLVV